MLTGPQSIDVLDVLYHVSHVVISAWLCFALIIHNPGDNHALRALVHLVGVVPLWGTTPWGPPGPSRGRARPRGGSKLSPPGDGRHLTDFVAN